MKKKRKQRIQKPTARTMINASRLAALEATRRQVVIVRDMARLVLKEIKERQGLARIKGPMQTMHESANVARIEAATLAAFNEVAK